MNDFKVGDKIFHKSNSSVVWIIERIVDDEVYCSTVIKETLEQKRENFAMTSIEKCAEPEIYISKRTRDNRW